jgi:hypothetical protein
LRTVGEMYDPIAEKDVSGSSGPRKRHRQSRRAAPVPDDGRHTNVRNESAASAFRLKETPDALPGVSFRKGMGFDEAVRVVKAKQSPSIVPTPGTGTRGDEGGSDCCLARPVVSVG